MVLGPAHPTRTPEAQQAFGLTGKTSVKARQFSTQRQRDRDGERCWQLAPRMRLWQVVLNRQGREHALPIFTDKKTNIAGGKSYKRFKNMYGEPRCRDISVKRQCHSPGLMGLVIRNCRGGQGWVIEVGRRRQSRQCAKDDQVFFLQAREQAKRDKSSPQSSCITAFRLQVGN